MKSRAENAGSNCSRLIMVVRPSVVHPFALDDGVPIGDHQPATMRVHELAMNASH